MKRAKPTSPLLFTFYSHFAAIHPASRDIFVTAVKARSSKDSQLAGARDFFSFSSCSLRSSRQRAYCSTFAGSGSSSPLSQKRSQSTDPPAAPCGIPDLSERSKLRQSSNKNSPCLKKTTCRRRFHSCLYLCRCPPFPCAVCRKLACRDSISRP